ncbi:MAG: hypothetical protein ABI643_03515 [Candidatus Doudnabacteria bacterium]
MKQKIYKLGLICILGLIFFNFAYAQQLVTCGGSKQPACQITDLIFLIERITNFLLSWAWLVSILFILWGAWEMINSGGNEEAVSKGKDIFKHAIIGFFLILTAYLFVNLIVSIITGQGNPRSGAFENVLNFLPQH